METCGNGNTSFWWSSVGQQINAIDVDNVGGPPGSPAGFVEIKQFFLPKTHFIRELAVSNLEYTLSVLALEDRQGGKEEYSLACFCWSALFFGFNIFVNR